MVRTRLYNNISPDTTVSGPLGAHTLNGPGHTWVCSKVVCVECFLI